MKQTAAHVTWMKSDDHRACSEIDAHGYADYWGEPDFREYQKERDQVGMVAMLDDDVAGFVCYQFMREKVLVHRLAVHPDNRRAGVGTALINKLKDKLTTARRNSIHVTVGERDAAAIAFLRACGFLGIGIDRGWAGDDDGIKFRFFIKAA